MEKKRKTTWMERIEADPELKAALEDNEERLVERIKQGHRERLARQAREHERSARESQWRERLRRFSFGLLGGDES